MENELETTLAVEEQLDSGANFDGLFDFILNDPSNIIVMIIAGVIGFIFFRKMNKGVKKLEKQQKQDVKVYKENKKEDLVEVKKIDDEMEIILEDLKEYSDKEVEIKNDIKKVIEETKVNINVTKINPEKKRTVSNANDRLRNHLKKISDKGNK